MAKKKTKIVWEGDLDDDCHTKYGKYTAHCECLGDGEVFEILGNGKINKKDKDHYRTESWWASIVYQDKSGEWIEVFDTNNSGGTFSAGYLARYVCECILRGLPK